MSLGQAEPAEAPGASGMDRDIIRQGFILILLALLGGIAAPTVMANPRLGAGAHTIGLFGGLILIAIGATKPVFTLDRSLWRTMQVLWLWGTYGNWVGTMLAGFTGASYLTPIAGAGTTGAAIAEIAVIGFFCAVGVTSVAGTLIAIYGLSGRGRGSS